VSNQTNEVRSKSYKVTTKGERDEAITSTPYEPTIIHLNLPLSFDIIQSIWVMMIRKSSAEELIQTNKKTVLTYNLKGPKRGSWKAYKKSRLPARPADCFFLKKKKKDTLPSVTP
jgi:hypothetical protein